MPGLALDAAWELDRGSIWSWAVRLVAAHHARDGWVTSDGTADFTLDVVTLQLCPARLGTARAGLWLCAGSTAGRLIARGSDSFSPRSRERPFVTAGGAAVLAVVPVPWLEVTASVEPAAALIRDRFAFDPDVFHAVPRLILTYGAGIAAKFP